MRRLVSAAELLDRPTAIQVLTAESILQEHGLTVGGANTNEGQRAIAAHHESGHAVVATVVLQRPVVCVEVAPDGRTGLMRGGREPGLAIEGHLLIIFAGPCAAMRRYPALVFEELDGGDCFDVREATELIAYGYGVETTAPIVAVELRRWRKRAAKLVDRHWGWINRVAEALIQTGFLKGADVSRLR